MASVDKVKMVINDEFYLIDFGKDITVFAMVHGMDLLVDKLSFYFQEGKRYSYVFKIGDGLFLLRVKKNGFELTMIINWKGGE